jgi:Holliday junction resolvase RusA-like endonuclease
MITREIVITVAGQPKPKGSMVCRRDPHHGLRESVDNVAWRAELVRLAKRVTQRAGKGQPIAVEATFTLKRSTAHYGTGRNAGVLKSWALALFPVGHDKGDVDKLARLVLDALQDARVLHDDCQVVELTTRKVFTETYAGDGLVYPGAVIRIWPHGSES